MGKGRRKLKRPPVALSLSRNTVADDHALLRSLAAQPDRTRHQVRALHSLFAFKSNERLFARILLDHKPEYWVFRCNQRCLCGDFIVVDMSCPVRERRKVYVIEMKERATLELGGRGAGNQFMETAPTLKKLARKTRAFDPHSPVEKVVGDLPHLLEFLGCPQTISCNQGVIA